MKIRSPEAGASAGGTGVERPLPTAFYERPVLEVAPDLIGCTVVHEGTAGVIVETEAYHEEEPACHAYVGRTPRSGILFGPPGVAYVYRSYGIHAMLNAVCEPEGVGAAVLIRALRPVAGIAEMRRRRDAVSARAALARGRDAPVLGDRDLCSGPGRLTQALGIELAENGTSLSSGPIVILPREQDERPEIAAATRVGITKAVELPWRFVAVGDPNVSRPWPWRAGRRRAQAARAVAGPSG
jgi:DNA-3-methyladenine glycosylase